MTREAEAQRVVTAFTALHGWLAGFTAADELRDTWGELLLRSVMASPEWREMRHACQAFTKATAVLL